MKGKVKVLFAVLLIAMAGCKNYDVGVADIAKNTEGYKVQEVASVVNNESDTVMATETVTDISEVTSEVQVTEITAAEIATTETTVAETTTAETTVETIISKEPTADQSAGDEVFAIYADGVVNVRVAPSTESKVLEQTYKNEKFQCIGKTGNWYIIEYDDSEAYVYEKYFSKTPVVVAGITNDDPYTYEDMETAIARLKETYTENFGVKVIGKTYDNRNMYLITLGNPQASKSVLFTAAIHGAEYMTSQLIMAQTEYYLANIIEEYDGKAIGDILDDVCVYILPMVNPDGVAISQYGFSVINDSELHNELMKLGYTPNWSSNARGVDLNRNFPTKGFGNENAENQRNSKPSFKYYEGEYAGSELETQIIMDFVNSHPTLMAYVSYHSKGEVIFWNKGQKGKLYNNTMKMARIIEGLTGYDNIEYSQVLSGIDYEWAILEAGLAGCTIEIGDGMAVFPLRQTQWDDVWSRNQYVMIAVADLIEELER